MIARALGVLFWLGVAAAAATVLIMAWRHPPRGPASTTIETSAAVTVPPAQPFQPLPLNRYTEIAQRPVFIAARRPETEEPTAPPPPPPDPDRPLNLIGVVLISGAATALLRPDEPNAKVLRVIQGEQIDGWQVQSVSADKVVLRKGNNARELALVRLPTPTRRTAREKNAQTDVRKPSQPPAPALGPGPGF